MNSVSVAFIFLDTPEILQYITKRFEDRIWQSGYNVPHKTSIRLFQKINYLLDLKSHSLMQSDAAAVTNKSYELFG